MNVVACDWAGGFWLDIYKVHFHAVGMSTRQNLLLKSSSCKSDRGDLLGDMLVTGTEVSLKSARRTANNNFLNFD